MNQPKVRLQFRLRTLFLFVLGAGVLLSAWAAWIEPYRVQRAAMRAIADASGSYQTEAGGPAWLRSLFGEDWFQDVVRVDLGVNTEAGVLEHLFHLPRLRRLQIGGRDFTDDHLARLEHLPELKEAVLISTSVSREFVEAVEQQRPDLALTIGLSFNELAGVPLDLAKGEIPWWTDKSWQFKVPESVRQWVGRRVRVTGHAIPEGGVNAGDDFSDKELQRLDLFCAGDVIVPPFRRVDISLKKKVCPEGFLPPNEADAEGILDFDVSASEPSRAVYRLTDATIRAAQ